jgi:hypothetical protein
MTWIERDCGYSTPCHIWTGGTSRGYGYDSAGRRYAHRVAWEKANGPAGQMHVHHLCSTKLCVNVSHLELRSPEEHRELHQPTNKRPTKLTREAVDDIRKSPETLQVIANRYGISKPYAAKVRRGLAPEDFLLEEPLPPWARGRSTPPRQKGRLTEEDVAYIRSSNASLGVLGEMFSLSKQYISLVKNGRAPRP